MVMINEQQQRRHCEPVRVKQSRILIISVMDWLTPKNWIASLTLAMTK
jgi:hypothetical protein